MYPNKLWELRYPHGIFKVDIKLFFSFFFLIVSTFFKKKGLYETKYKIKKKTNHLFILSAGSREGTICYA